MKESLFIYPTKKNSLIILLGGQMLPLCLTLCFSINKPIVLWIAFQFLLFMSICMWRLKPVKEMDEREKAIELKNSNRMYHFSMSCLIFPITALSVDPSINGWNVLMLFAIPAYLLVTVISIICKKEIGYFFAPEQRHGNT